MSDEAERRRLSANAPQILRRFDLDRIMKMWRKSCTKRLSSRAADKTPDERHKIGATK